MILQYYVYHSLVLVIRSKTIVIMFLKCRSLRILQLITQSMQGFLKCNNRHQNNRYLNQTQQISVYV